VRRSPSARLWRLEVPWGEPARLTAPTSISQCEVEQVLRDKRAWIEEQRRRQVPRLGLEGLAVSESAARIAARELVSALAEEEAGRLPVAYGRIRIGGQRTLWGSCSPAARSPSTGASCSRPPRCSTTWSCTNSATCASPTTRGASGSSSSRAARTGANSATGCASTAPNCSPSERPSDAPHARRSDADRRPGRRQSRAERARERVRVSSLTTTCRCGRRRLGVPL
jgi:hypothetical protein